MPSSVYTLADEGSGNAAVASEEAAEAPAEKASKPAPKAEEPKAEEPKAEEPKAEAPKAEEPKAEEPKAEEPKAEEPKAEEPNAAEEPSDEGKAEADKPADKPAAEEEKAEEPEYPAVKLNDTVGDVDVEVNAPEGALPDGVKLDVDKVSADEAEKVVADFIAEDKDIDEIMSVDLSFVKDGKKVEPKKTVTVKLSSDKIQGKDLAVYNRDSSNNVRKLEGYVTANSGKYEGKDFARLVMVTVKDKEDADSESSGEEGEDAEEADPDAEAPVVDAEEEPAADPEDEAAYPKQSFTDSASGVAISVEAPKGALPEGTKMKAKGVGIFKMPSVKRAVEAEMGENADVVKAVDITFYDAEGNEVQPKVPVSVNFSSSSFDGIDEPAVVHIDDSGANKLADSIVDANNNDVTFEADSFSIYAIVETGDDARIKVIFKGLNNEEIASMYVKKADDMDVVLYDPGAGTLADGVYFRGWTTDQNYTPETTALTIDDVRTAVSGMLEPESDGTVVTYYAMLFKDYRITYLDEKGISLGQQEVTFRADSASAEQSYKVNMGYTVQSDTEHFEGWNVNEGESNIVSATLNGQSVTAPYENNTILTITGDVVLGVNAPKGHWFII